VKPKAKSRLIKKSEKQRPDIEGGEHTLLFPDMETVGCKRCKSPFHDEEDCPQVKLTAAPTKFKSFRFPSRKDMNLKSGEVPFKFRVEFDPKDDEVEISRKRSLLRLNSDKVYKIMAYAVKAQESQRAALQYLIRLTDEMDIDDKVIQEERKALLGVVQTLDEVFARLSAVRTEKIKQAERMEELATKARSTARKARTRMSKQRQQDREFWVLRLPDSNVDTQLIYDEEPAINPADLIKQAADAILRKEEEKDIRTSDGDEG
jgi:hypothetical protein